jgi:hypothetical protein
VSARRYDLIIFLYDDVGKLTENPFASNASLDTNPFDDPTAAYPSAPANDRAADLARRERELAAREEQVRQREQNVRTIGAKNWPFCESSG